jgi:hypothetical protein
MIYACGILAASIATVLLFTAYGLWGVTLPFWIIVGFVGLTTMVFAISVIRDRRH